MRILNRLRFYKYVLTKDMTQLARFNYENFKVACDVLAAYVGDIAGKTILDIGCGRLYPQTLLFHGAGARVTGIDNTYIGTRDPLCLKYWRSLTRSGLEGLARDVLYDLLGKNRAYYRQLSRLSGFKFKRKSLDIKQMDVENMSFPDGVFDIAVSNNVFEHIADIPKAIAEVYRVLKRGGIIYIRINLFTSLSGGHNFDLSNPGKVPPWDHLRGNRYKVPVYLNKLGQDEYISLFGQRFKILDVIDGQYVGKDLLTPSLRAELTGYSEEELLKTHITIIGRK